MGRQPAPFQIRDDMTTKWTGLPSPSSDVPLSAGPTGLLVLEDGSVFRGRLFGHLGASAGEVVFNTGMVGYPEALTDPSYKGQILALTYPLTGNYGVPRPRSDHQLPVQFESTRVQVSGLIVSELCTQYSHRSASQSLDQWLAGEGVAGLAGIDTRTLTKRLRANGSMLGKIVPEGCETEFVAPNKANLVDLVSVREAVTYQGGP